MRGKEKEAIRTARREVRAKGQAREASRRDGRPYALKRGERPRRYVGILFFCQCRRAHAIACGDAPFFRLFFLQAFNRGRVFGQQCMTFEWHDARVDKAKADAAAAAAAADTKQPAAPPPPPQEGDVDPAELAGLGEDEDSD